MVPIVTIVPKPTTITLHPTTRRRLADYKRGDSTFDDVLNRLMDAVPLEDLMEDDIREHYARLNDPKTVWVDAATVKQRLKASLDESAPRGRRTRSA